MLLRHFVITSFFKINVITSFCYYVVFKCYYVITRGTRARREKRLKPTGGKIYTVKSTRRPAAKSGAWKWPYIGGLVLLVGLKMPPPPRGKVLTLDQFLKRKTSKENVTTVRSCKMSKSNPNEEVTVFIGIKRLKMVVKGKRLPVRVPKSATCKLILQKAIEKITAFDRSFDADENNMTCYLKIEALRCLCPERKIFLN